MKIKERKSEIRWLKIIGKNRLIVCLIIIFPLIVFCERAFQGEVSSFDMACLELLSSLRNPTLSSFSLFYWLGDADTSAFIVAVSLGVLGWKRYWNEAVVLAFAALGILLMVDKGLKPFFARYRPPDHIPSAIGYSFPSGHASGNTMLYFYIASILAVRFPTMAVYFYGLASIFLIFMGFASVYTRAHWLSDILAGYCVGFIWFTIVIAILNISNFKTQRYY